MSESSNHGKPIPVPPYRAMLPEKPVLMVQKLTESARLPSQAYEAGAYDLYCDTVKRNKDIGMVETAIVGTGLAIAIPDGYVGLVFSRSGQGFKYDVRLSNSVGVIDSDYRGEIKIKLAADSFEGENYLSEIHPEYADPIAQLLIIKKEQFNLVLVGELPSTERGDKGFGSSNQSK